MKDKSLKINAILNGLKQCFGILFPLITFPYVSRTLGEDGFGKYSFSWSIVSYFVLLAGLGVSTYAIREGARIRDDKEKLSQFCSEAFTINVITTIISLCLLVIISIVSTKIRNYLPLILIQSSALILNLIGRDWINSIYEDYFYITVRYLIIQLISLCLMFALIRLPEDVWKYCVVTIVASFGGNITNIFYLRRHIKTHIVIHPNFKKHVPALLILFATQIAITIYVNADITMLGFYADDATVGIYSLSSKIYSLIKTVVNAMVLVTLPRMTYIIDNAPERYEASLKKISSYLMVILFPISCGVFMLNKEVIMIAGGPSYQSGSTALRILSGAMIFAVLCSFCMNSILIVHRKEKECLKATAISAITNVALNFVALPLLGMSGAAITTIIAEAVNLVLLLRSSSKIVDLKMFDWKNAIQCLVSSGIIVIACVVIKRFQCGVMVTFIISFLVSAIGYFIVLIFLRNTCVQEILNSVMSSISRGRRKA